LVVSSGQSKSKPWAGLPQRGQMSDAMEAKRLYRDRAPGAAFPSRVLEAAPALSDASVQKISPRAH
jgi:hypothetical protein